MSASYRIKTLGIQQGFQRERVEARLMLLFRRPLEAVRPIAEGQGKLLKKGLAQAEAERFRAALAQCGCLCVVEEEVAAAPRNALAEYAQLLQAHLQALDPGRTWQFLAEDGELYGVPGPASPYPLDLAVPLARLHQEWQAASPQASEDLLRYTAGMVLMGNMPGEAEEAARFLLPIVRNSAERRQAELAAASGYSPLLHRPLCEGLEVGLAYHRGKVVHRVAQTHLDAWDLSEDQAYAAAYANLRERTGVPDAARPCGVFADPWDDGYGASRMLLPEVLQVAAQGAAGAGRPVVMVPTRGTLFLCSDASETALASMLKLAIEAMREARIVSPRMWRLVDGQWQPFVPAAHARRLNSLLKYAESNDYRLQKELLVNRLAAEGRAVYVASYLVGKTGPEQRRTSACTWTRGVASLLARTDLLCLADPADQAASVTVGWDAAMPVVGALLQRTDDYPPRYLVEEFPNALQLAQLRDLAAAARSERLAALAPVPAPKPAPQAPARRPWGGWRALAGMWTDTHSASAR